MKFYSDPKLQLEHERNLALGKIADAINGEGKQNASNRRRRRNMILGINTKEAVENFIKEQLQNKDISPEMVAAIAELMKALLLCDIEHCELCRELQWTTRVSNQEPSTPHFSTFVLCRLTGFNARCAQNDETEQQSCFTSITRSGTRLSDHGSSSYRFCEVCRT